MADNESRRTDSRIALGFGMLAVAALAVVMLRPGSTSTGVLDEPAFAFDPSGQPVVAALRSSGGFSLFGLRVVDATHYVEVRFLTAPGCSTQIEGGDPWPSDHEVCRGPSGIEGTVGGLGVSVDGSSIVGVEFAVPGECHDRLQPGMPWPVDHADCRG